MEVNLFDDAARFSDAARSFLASEPFSTNVIGVRLAGALDGSRPARAGDLWATVDDDGVVAGAAMHTPPHHLFVSRMPDAAAQDLSRALAVRDRPVPGVNGEEAAVSAFAETWTRSTGRTSVVQVSMCLYRLSELVVPSAVPGAARMAGAGDRTLIADWIDAFGREAMAHQAGEAPGEVADRLVRSGLLSVWDDDGESVSMAARSKAAEGVARIGPVFTPRRHRRRGYGAAVTAHASLSALEGGATAVVLYADLANPTSNGIYRAMGYVADHHSVERRFSEG